MYICQLPTSKLAVFLLQISKIENILGGLLFNFSMEAVQKLRETLNSSALVMSGSEYVQRSDAMFNRADLPGNETIVIQYSSMTDKSRIFLEKINDTVFIPESWRDDNRATQLMTLLHKEGYRTDFKRIDMPTDSV